MTQQDARAIHLAFLDGLEAAARSDGVFSASEIGDLRRVAKALGFAGRFDGIKPGDVSMQLPPVLTVIEGGASGTIQQEDHVTDSSAAAQSGILTEPDVAVVAADTLVAEAATPTANEAGVPDSESDQVQTSRSMTEAIAVEESPLVEAVCVGMWGADPWGRFELRWWDGRQWTPYVSHRGQHGTDPWRARLLAWSLEAAVGGARRSEPFRKWFRSPKVECRPSPYPLGTSAVSNAGMSRMKWWGFGERFARVAPWGVPLRSQRPVPHSRTTVPQIRCSGNSWHPKAPSAGA